MKKTIGMTMVLIATLIVFFSCNDDKSLLTDTSSSTSLSSDLSEDVITVKCKNANGLEISKKIIPVLWDGVSPLEDGVCYQFSSSEELEAAYADKPALLEARAKYFKSLEDGKKKIASQTKLASFTATAQVIVYTYPGLIEAECYTYANALNNDHITGHHHEIWKGPNKIYSMSWGDSSDAVSWHSSGTGDIECPIGMRAYCYVYNCGTSPCTDADAYDEDSCVD